MFGSNLPPGVTDADIPGNRPEDQEKEITLVLTLGDIDELIRYKRGSTNFDLTIESIVEQIKEEYPDIDAPEDWPDESRHNEAPSA